MSGGVASRRGKVYEVPELAAAEAEAPALKLICDPRDGEATAIALVEDLCLSYVWRSMDPRVYPPRRIHAGSFTDSHAYEKCSVSFVMFIRLRRLSCEVDHVKSFG